MNGAGIPGRERVTFRPRVTVGLLYFLVFFFGICWVLALPGLLEVAQSVPPGPEQQVAAREATAALLRGNLPIAAGLALVLTALGIYAGWLPGTRAKW